jgi:TolB-like protein/class 3 adenylate cyclase/Tfp pilus assembly protein PilF
MERRLAAVLIADVAGYGRLSQVDEEGTRTRFLSDLHDLFEPAIVAHRGRLIKTMGDGLLVEFPSVVDAVRCGVEVQLAKVESNATVPEDRRLAYRVGVNLGDVIVEHSDIHGAGVNIAERLQALADPGGVTISGTVYDQVRNNVRVGFEFRGEQRVKNIAEPVRVYSVLLEPGAAGTFVNSAPRTRWRRPALVTGVLMLIGAVAAGAWLRPWQPKIEAASVERMALPLPDKPSIAVLPLANMSNDPNQDYFADGITDDLITELSKVAGLFVIARNTSFTYKGKNVAIAQVAEELGVRYVLEGSVQRSGERVRINAQLIDALSGGHVWADRFDGSLTDVFALQDKVTNSTADALAVRLTAKQQASIVQRETSVPAAYEAFLRGWEHYRRTTPDDYAKAIPYLEEAIKLDPKYYRAHAALAMVYVRSYTREWMSGLGKTGGEVRDRARQHLREAQKQPSAMTHHAAGLVLLDRGSFQDALAEFKEAITLDPGDAWSYAFVAVTLTSLNRSAEAIPYIDAAMRLDPRFPPLFLYILGFAQYHLTQYSDAAQSLESATRRNPDDPHSFLALAATYGRLGRKQEASAAVARYNELAVAQGGSPVAIATVASDSFCGCGTDYLGPLDEGLRLAGVPEFLDSGEFADRNRLTADQIRALFFGHRLHGRSVRTGEERAASFTAQGMATMSGDWVLSRSRVDGTSHFSGDKLCVRFGPEDFCGDVYRNPGGSKAKGNEYIWFTGSAFTFSPVD